MPFERAILSTLTCTSPAVFLFRQPVSDSVCRSVFCLLPFCPLLPVIEIQFTD